MSGKKGKKLPVRQANPNPRDGLDRPTPERLARGDYRQADTGTAGESYYIDHSAFAIDAMRTTGKITPEHWRACELFTERVTAYRAQAAIRNGPRSCLDMSPVGYDDSDGDPQVKADYNEIANRLGFHAFNLLDNALCRGEDIRNESGVVWALNELVDLWGLTTVKKWLR